MVIQNSSLKLNLNSLANNLEKEIEKMEHTYPKFGEETVLVPYQLWDTIKYFITQSAMAE
jgi:hypothetical protein